MQVFGAVLAKRGDGWVDIPACILLPSLLADWKLEINLEEGEWRNGVHVFFI